MRVSRDDLRILYGHRLAKVADEIRLFDDEVLQIDETTIPARWRRGLNFVILTSTDKVSAVLEEKKAIS